MLTETMRDILVKMRGHKANKVQTTTTEAINQEKDRDTFENLSHIHWRVFTLKLAKILIRFVLILF